MQSTPTLKHLIHLMHEEVGKFMHFAGHLLHEKSFWIIAGLVVLMAALFAILVLWGSGSVPEFRSPQYIW